MHMNGANHTPSNSQSHIVCCTTSCPTISQPRPKKIYRKYRMSLPGIEDDGDESESGRPSKTASKAASEKFSTEIIDVTVEAKQRLSDFNMI